MTARLLPEKRTRAPLLEGCRPSPASMRPAFTSSSLNLPISVRSCSLGIWPASDALVALTMTMTFMTWSPLSVACGCRPRTVFKGGGSVLKTPTPVASRHFAAKGISDPGSVLPAMVQAEDHAVTRQPVFWHREISRFETHRRPPRTAPDWGATLLQRPLLVAAFLAGV